MILAKFSVRAMALAVLFETATTAGQAQIVTDGTVGPALAIGGPDHAITADLGRRAGGNLFHSFSQFNIATGARATFSGPDDVRAVISRVTGGAASLTDGTLRSTIPEADPSRPGTSDPDSSTVRLSMFMPQQTASRCSTVSTWAELRIKRVRRSIGVL